MNSLLFVGYQFSWFWRVGWSTKLRIQRTMKLGNQFDTDYAILRFVCLMIWSFLVDLLPDETCYFENIKSTNFILGTVFVTNTKSKNLRIHELVIFTVYIKYDNLCKFNKFSENIPNYIYIYMFIHYNQTIARQPKKKKNSKIH